MDKIEAVISRIQAKWGQQAVRSARYLSLPPRVYPTGFHALDALIGGGFARAQVTELRGRPTSGMTTLAYHSLARSQQQGANIVVVDSLSSLNMTAAAACGVNVENLVLVEIEDLPLLLNLLRELLHSGVVSYLLVNLPGLRRTSLPIRPLMRALHHSDCALVLLLPPWVQSDAGSLRLQIERRNWLRHRGDIVGCLSAVRVEKQPSGKAGVETLLLLPFEQETWA